MIQLLLPAAGNNSSIGRAIAAAFLMPASKARAAIEQQFQDQ